MTVQRKTRKSRTSKVFVKIEVKWFSIQRYKDWKELTILTIQQVYK